LSLLDSVLGERLKKDFLDLLSSDYQKVLEYILLADKSDPEPEIKGLVNLVYLQADTVPIKTVETVNDSSAKKKYAMVTESVDVEAEFNELISNLKGHKTGDKKKVLLERISDAEAKKDEEKLMKLLKEYQDLTKN